MSNTLLPCPFCGGEALMRERYINGVANTKHYIRECHHCKATFAHWFRSMKKADAAWNRRVDARQLALKTRVCPMCEDCPDGCPVETPKDSRNIVTNADRIRSMSDKELAEYIFDLGNGSEYCYGHCAYQDDCATKGLDHDTCIKGVIDWLKQPVKEE